jgi:hypothetical protein
VFDDKSSDRLPTSKLLEALHVMEEAPWGSLRGEALDARGLARLLKPYGVKPEKLREGEDTFRGYRRTSFEDAWIRYLSAPPGEAEHVEHPEHFADRAGSDVPHKQDVPEHAGYVEHKEAHKKGDVPRVPDVPHNPVPGERPLSDALEPGQSGWISELADRREEIATALGQLFDGRPDARNDPPPKIARDLDWATDLGYEPSAEAVEAALEAMA